MIRESIYKRYIPSVVFPVEQKEPSLWFIYSSNKLLVKMEGDTAQVPCIAKPEEVGLTAVRTQYLGTLDGMDCYSAEVPDEETGAEGLVFSELRSQFGILEDDIFLLAGRAFQIINWDRNRQYCGRCGTLNTQKPDERAKLCPECGLIDYPAISPAIIVAIVKDNRILLAHAKHFRENMYSVIAGFVEPGETFEECVRREVREEVGIGVKNIRYFASQPWPFPNSLMVGFTAEYDGGEIKVDGVEISDAGWFESTKLPNIPGKNSIARELIDWFTDNYK